MIGKTLGHYKILDKLGQGAMGEVYRATDTKLGREVALKTLPGEFAESHERLARFRREAQAVARLNHAHIVTIYSIEEADGVHFLTMELVEGKTLDHTLGPQGLPLSQLEQIASDLASALVAAHGQGIVHRDLKPANLMLTTNGQLKVLDFGLAKVDQPASNVADAATIAQPLSVVGQVMGTVPYMSPEQLRGEEVDARTDLFSFGTLLYEFATGQRPFQGETLGVVSTAILRDDPPPAASLRKDLPATLASIIDRCLQKDPGGRMATAAEILEALESKAPAILANSAFRVDAPAPSTPTLGRERDLEKALVQIEAGARLLTISGYGGTGKTRFSTELYLRLADRYPAGAAFVALAAVTDAEEVMPWISQRLDIAEAHGRSALEALCTVVGDREMLLVLDNLEQVLDAAGDIGTLVSRCPKLQVVTTSRAPLRISAETEFVLPPLALPEKDEPSLKRLMACPSVELFVQRAGRVKPGFALNEENAKSVAEICRRLDGSPLALELAAARVRILDPAKLLLRLDNALDLLSSGDRDLPLRQRTLRATISWSYSLLEAPEQKLLCGCSVFHDGWTFEAMENVCYDEADNWRALDELESLVEKGLVRVLEGGRYTLLETIRAFSAEQLHAGGNFDRLRTRHANYFGAFMAIQFKRFRSNEQINATEAVRADHANEYAAIAWLTTAAKLGEANALEEAMLLAGHLDWFWHVGGLHNTARLIYDELLALAKDHEPSRGRALAWLGAGMVSTTTGEWERSLQEWTRGYEDALVIGDADLASEGCMGQGYVQLNVGRLEEAGPPLEECLVLSANGVSDFMRALALALKGMLVFQRGELDAGMELVEEGLRIQRSRNDCEGGGIAVSLLASMYFARGDLAEAHRLYLESLSAFLQIGDRPEIARVYYETGWTELADQKTAAAGQSFRNAVETYQEVGSARGTGLALLGLAAVEMAEGRTDRAVTIAAAAQALSERAGVVCDHPMDPGVVERIEKLKATIPTGEVDGLMAHASEMSPAQILTMVDGS